MPADIVNNGQSTHEVVIPFPLPEVTRRVDDSIGISFVEPDTGLRIESRVFQQPSLTVCRTIISMPDNKTLFYAISGSQFGLPTARVCELSPSELQNKDKLLSDSRSLADRLVPVSSNIGGEISSGNDSVDQSTLLMVVLPRLIESDKYQGGTIEPLYNSIGADRTYNLLSSLRTKLNTPQK